MLYVTTRNNTETYTAWRAASESRGPDGGIYIPWKIVPFSREELAPSRPVSISESIALAVGRFLGIRIGDERPVSLRLSSMGHRIAVCEMGDLPYDVLFERVKSVMHIPLDLTTPWLEICVRIAVIFAVYRELLQRGALDLGEQFDVSVISGGFYGPMSGWYAREMGIPVGNVICGCNENSCLWDLIYRGELRTDRVCIDTLIPEADITVPDGLECLISNCCGIDEVKVYLEAVRTGKTYHAGAFYDTIRKGFHVSVVSKEAILRTIPNVFSTSGILLPSGGALAYAGLLDYRARTGESKTSIVFTG